MLSLAIGDVSQAVGHFEDSLAFCAKAGYRPEFAWTCWGYSAALLDRGSQDDRRRAESLLDEALQISMDLGMPALRQRVEDLMSQAGKAPTPAYPGGLTQREVEVLRLISSGKTGREVSKELIIAIHTVTTHVGNILNQTGTTNRTEAANYANQHGLATPIADD